MEAIALVKPGAALLPGYVAALRTGWSPSNLFDLSAAHLAAIEADAAAFLAGYDGSPGSTNVAPDGRTVPRLPGQLFWISDGSFCGFMSFRHQPGTPDLPDHVSGHVGYGVVPWQRRRGVATAALRAVLPVARAAGLDRVLITTDPDNEASRRVILAAGGASPTLLPGSKLGFWVPTRNG